MAANNLSVLMLHHLRRIKDAGDAGFRGWHGRTHDALLRRDLITGEMKDWPSRIVTFKLTDAGREALK